MENHADFTVRELASILCPGEQPGLRLHGRLRATWPSIWTTPLRLAGIMAPHALTTHFKNYRDHPHRRQGLALENCALGDGDIDLVAIAELLAKHNPQINLNIEIHSQFAPFRLDMLDATFLARHPSPPGDGLAWYLAKAWDEAAARILGPRTCPTGRRPGSARTEHLRQLGPLGDKASSVNC